MTLYHTLAEAVFCLLEAIVRHWSCFFPLSFLICAAFIVEQSSLYNSPFFSSLESFLTDRKNSKLFYVCCILFCSRPNSVKRSTAAFDCATTTLCYCFLMSKIFLRNAVFVRTEQLASILCFLYIFFSSTVYMLYVFTEFCCRSMEALEADDANVKLNLRTNYFLLLASKPIQYYI